MFTNTLHPHKISRKSTWHSSNDLTYQIDYILMPPRFKSSIHAAITRTYPRADINSDPNSIPKKGDL